MRVRVHRFLSCQIAVTKPNQINKQTNLYQQHINVRERVEVVE